MSAVEGVAVSLWPKSGYRAHLTETCDEERPELVVRVATTLSTVQDIELTDTIHDDLAERQLLPAEHVVDSGYVSPARIERAQRVHGITLPGRLSPSTAARPRSARALIRRLLETECGDGGPYGCAVRVIVAARGHEGRHLTMPRCQAAPARTTGTASRTPMCRC
ncbi:hypothetical protein [Streptomyces sp. PSKA30]|uniref:hypothetical protein n=1 Tax=Streptomyces sp. PSKA30 TaxID=2874597 RepID=UPI0035B045B7